MEVAQLRSFLAVAEELHFGRAAKRLHLTIAPVSRAVKELERELGVQLFVRDHRSVELTRAGSRLATHAAAVLAGLERLRIEARLAASEAADANW